MKLAQIVAGARKLTQGGLRPVLISAAVAFGVAQLQQLAAEAEDRAEDAETAHNAHVNHVALLQAQISDLEGQALNSVRAAIASGLYDDAVRTRADELQKIEYAADPTSQLGYWTTGTGADAARAAGLTVAVLPCPAPGCRRDSNDGPCSGSPLPGDPCAQAPVKA